MNYKDKLKAILKQFNELKESTLAKSREIRNSDKYTDDYKRELIEGIKRECIKYQEDLCNQAIEIISNAKNELLKRKTAVNRDQAFDIKLNNTLSILNSVGKDMNVKELEELINPFKEDYFTMKILRRVFVSNELRGITEIFGFDTIDHNVGALEKLEREINKVLTGDIEQSNIMKLIIAIDMLKEN